MLKRAMVLAAAVFAAMGVAAPAASAAPPPGNVTAPAPDSTRIVLLGTAGGPVARVKRAQPAALVEVDDDAYLVDAGDGVARQLAELGLQPKDIHRVFITHLHMDHMAGLATLIGFSWTARAEEQMLIFGPAGTQSVVDGAYAYMRVPAGIFAEQLPPGRKLEDTARVVEVRGAGPSVIYRDDKVKVTAVENSHYDTMDKARMPDGSKSYALRFDTPDRSIVFTGDTGPSDAVEKLAAGADVLVSEVIDIKGAIAFLKRQYPVSDKELEPQVAHMTREHFLPEEIGKMASRAGVKMVVLTHVVMGFDDETDMRRYTDGVRRYFKGPVVMGHDLDEF